MPKKKPIYSPHGGLSNSAFLKIIHVPTGRQVIFDAYLDGFSDMYTSEWNAEDVYGRMDPIATFIGTRRALSLAWKVPAASEFEAGVNLQKANLLFSFLYPLYETEGVGGATAINQSPLLRMSFGNLIRNPVSGRGLLGYVNGFTFDPDLEAGMFYGRPDPNGYHANLPSMDYLPKTFRLNCEFNILHEHSLGFQRASMDNKTFSFRDPKVNDANYPYLVTDEAPRYPKYTPGTKAQNPNPKAGKPAADTGPQIDFQTGKLIPELGRAEREANATRSAATGMLQPTAAEDAAVDSLLDSVKDD
jgi:hypothetical protein